MKLLIIRHGDPDYTIDSLTEKGKREAELLALKLEKENIDKIYVSPLGRARDTAEYTLRRKGMDGVVCEWLKEFPPKIQRPDLIDGQKHCIWDWLPADWTVRENFYSAEKWCDEPELEGSGAREEYERVTGEFDKLLASHGYVREGKYYRAVRSNSDTIALFCHFGLECVLLSHLMSISPMPLWHGFCAAPTSVTTIYTEERREGIASFRAATFGDVSHLYAGGEEPAFAARWCETFDRVDQRH
jgi:probable phosphoglycerate mutase